MHTIQVYNQCIIDTHVIMAYFIFGETLYMYFINYQKQLHSNNIFFTVFLNSCIGLKSGRNILEYLSNLKCPATWEGWINICWNVGNTCKIAFLHKTPKEAYPAPSVLTHIQVPPTELWKTFPSCRWRRMAIECTEIFEHNYCQFDTLMVSINAYIRGQRKTSIGCWHVQAETTRGQTLQKHMFSWFQTLNLSFKFVHVHKCWYTVLVHHLIPNRSTWPTQIYKYTANNDRN